MDIASGARIGSEKRSVMRDLRVEGWRSCRRGEKVRLRLTRGWSGVSEWSGHADLMVR